MSGCEISNFRPLDKNTLRGFFDLELPFGGLVIRGCCFHQKGESQWIGWPGRPYGARDGGKAWATIIDFADSKSKYKLQDEVLPLVLAALAGELKHGAEP